MPVGGGPTARAAGAGHGVRLFPPHLGDNDPISAERGHPVGNVVADLRAGPGPADAGMGSGGRHRRHRAASSQPWPSPAPWRHRSSWPHHATRNTRAWSNGSTAFWRPRFSCRNFEASTDFNTQISDWLLRANGRTERAIRGKPIDLLEPDYQAMLPLPPVVPPIGLGRRHLARLGFEPSQHCTLADRQTDGLRAASLSPDDLDGSIFREPLGPYSKTVDNPHRVLIGVSEIEPTLSTWPPSAGRRPAVNLRVRAANGRRRRSQTRRAQRPRGVRVVANAIRLQRCLRPEPALAHPDAPGSGAALRPAG
jgi:hypothetical protein